MTKTPSTAYLLVSHGSRDPRPQAAMDRLAQLVRELLLAKPVTSRPSEPSPLPGFPRPRRQELPPLPLVGTACLELGPLPLHQQIVQFSQRAWAASIQRVRVVPIFLMRGVHVAQDIPTQLELARPQLPADLTLEVSPVLGSHGSLKALLQTRQQSVQADAWMLLAHGSRRPGGNRPIVQLASELGAAVAFWSVASDFERQLVQLIQQGHQRLMVLPYFLFPGGITDAITRYTEELAERFPQVQIRLLPPLGASPDLAELVADLAQWESAGRVGPPAWQRLALRY